MQRKKPPLLIEGPPGSGKSFLLLKLMQWLDERNACCQDDETVIWEVTAVSAHRSAQIGGWHIYSLFGFRPPPQHFFLTPHQLFGSSMKSLSANPEKRKFLQELKVLAIDEFGQVGGCTVLAMDMVLREVRGCNEVFGGVWVVACGDHYQTEPINEIPPLMCWFVRHHFGVIRLKEMFRARGDLFLMEMIRQMRQPVLTPETVEGILQCIAAL